MRFDLRPVHLVLALLAGMAACIVLCREGLLLLPRVYFSDPIQFFLAWIGLMLLLGVVAAVTMVVHLVLLATGRTSAGWGVLGILLGLPILGLGLIWHTAGPEAKAVAWGVTVFGLLLEVASVHSVCIALRGY
jgi:hypothetical protein